MTRLIRVLSLAAGISAAAALAASTAHGQKPKDEKKPMARVVKTILLVDYETEESNPPVLVVTAVGQVPTGGWTEAKLMRRTYKKPPADGIYEYDLTAVPPDGAATQVLSKVKATDRWKDPPRELKGFKVYGAGKGVKTVMVKGR
jgi:hypothetical protein